MKKIIHLISPYLFHTGSWVYSQIKGLTNFEHYVFTQKTENLDQFPLDNIYSMEDNNKLKQLLNYLNFRINKNYGLYFDKFMDEINPKLFHAHMGYQAVPWLSFVKKYNVPLITTFYGLDVSQLGQIPWWREKYLELFDYGSYFLAEGPNLRKQLLDLGCPPEKAIVQPLGIKVDKYPPKNYPKKDKIIILQTSTFREKKGIEYSLEALSKLMQTNSNFEYRLIGAGDSPEVDEKMKDLAKRLGVFEKTKFLGKLPHLRTIEEMSKCDIFLHPSVQAKNGDNEGGAPVGLIEACATGCPAVSTLHADIPEVVVNEKTGFLVQERNSDQICEKLMTLIENESLRKEFGENARQFIIEKFDIDKIIKGLNKIYLEFE